MSPKLTAAAIIVLMLAPAAASAAESSLQIQLSSESGDFERHVIHYDCGTEAPLSVSYINAAPNFLALLPVADQPQPLLFTAVISASGVRYASGQWIWWSKGADASLYDETLGEDAAAVLTCTEVNNTP